MTPWELEVGRWMLSNAAGSLAQFAFAASFLLAFAARRSDPGRSERGTRTDNLPFEQVARL